MCVLPSSRPPFRDGVDTTPPPPPTPPKHPSPCPSIPKVVLMQIRETKRCPAVEAGKLMGWFGF